MTNLWSAPYRGQNPIHASLTIPGSKSVTNRALILAALSNTPSILRRPLHSRDSALMISGLISLGVGIEQMENGDLTVTPGKLNSPAAMTAIEVGNAGTVMRFLPPVAAMANGLIQFDGDARSHERPLAPVIRALESLGVSVEHGSRYSLPLTINAQGQLKGGTVEVDATLSSQFISALLLVAPATKDGITVRNIGTSTPSLPHIEMTIAMLRERGVEVILGENEWTVKPSIMAGVDSVIEPDLSNAAPFIGAAMMSGGTVLIRDWPRSTTQPGDQLRQIFTTMGAHVEIRGDDLAVTGDQIHGLDIDLHDIGELTPSIAALCLFADSPSYLRGIAHLRTHETDRLSALATEINNLGGEIIEEPSALRIIPKPLHSGVFHTYDDHRLATAGAMIGLRVKGIEVENIETTRKTLPDFPGAWCQLLNGDQ